ncbi:uncharacterized protein (DUF427 family) [Mesorhizobium sp. J18]|uniref:DUF427 domain-containing protein n=1 Tax=Mesorhizobium sp. J18 TaxID=935263 RepID=UPI00119A4FF1|nr:DUF427 domain-containing protein [Mesorhizobium sp. J18]TWG90647.1 uncharacterized protein (DUF427 family) [Mesorhizobium sp. J18]
MSGTPNPASGFAQNPQKKITVEPHKGRVTVKMEDVVIAASSQAKILKEDGYPPVLYIPFEDIAFAHLERTTTKTHCPYKGDATYWRLGGSGKPAHDVMWAYENPYDETAEIKDHGAFYTDLVNVETE